MPMSKVTGSVERRTLRDQSIEALRSAILKGELVPGEHLRETELSQRFAVSRSTVREALFRLAEDGLVDIDAHRGTRVRVLPADEVKEIYEVRAALEGLAARCAAQRCAKGGRPLIEPILTRAWEQMGKANVSKSFVSRTAADLAFHEAICVASNNGWLVSTWRRLSGPIRTAILSSEPTVVTPYQGAERHRAVLEAILAGDPDVAAADMQRHLEESATGVYEAILAKEAERTPLVSA